MAIKGKRRTRATRRGIAAAPRPHLVIPRKPLLRRRGVQITLVVVLVAAIGGLVFWGLRTRSNNQRLAREREDVSSFGAFVEEVLQRRAMGQAVVTQFLILPELPSAVAELKAGRGNPTELVEQARGWSDRSAAAAEDIAGLQPELGELREARNLLRRGLELYSSAASTLTVAARLDGQPQKNLIASLEKQITAAAEVWDIGWTKLASARIRLGILTPAPLPPPGQPGGFPGG
jgi:hypothetical protein